MFNATATPFNYRQTRPRFELPGTLDARFAVGVTSTYSHPQILIESVYREYWGYFSRSLTPEQRETVREDRIAQGRGYWIADDVAALDSVWAQMAAGAPDAIKVYLSDTARGLAAGDVRGRGLHPDVLAEVVRRAHGDGLRVVAHVETADDARLAVAAGVDGLMHLPGYRIVSLSDPSWTAQRADAWALYPLDDETVRRMAARGVFVTPTVHLNADRARYRDDGAERLAEARAVQFAEIRRLWAAGVPIAVGLDGSDGTTRAEAAYMAEHDLFTPAELLRIWTTETPQTIVPDRRVGEIRPGFEASLLVLGCDPLADFGCTQDIRERVKDGVVLPDPPATDD